MLREDTCWWKGNVRPWLAAHFQSNGHSYSIYASYCFPYGEISCLLFMLIAHLLCLLLSIQLNSFNFDFDTFTRELLRQQYLVGQPSLVSRRRLLRSAAVQPLLQSQLRWPVTVLLCNLLSQHKWVSIVLTLIFFPPGMNFVSMHTNIFHSAYILPHRRSESISVAVPVVFT